MLELEQELGFEQPDSTVDMENRKFTCYGLRFHKDQVIVTIDNKNACKFFREEFPQHIDLDDVAQVTSMLQILRESGLQTFIHTFGLPTP